jgi:hypothetical protein
MALDLNQNISLNYCLRVALRWKNFCLVLLKVAAFQVLSNILTLRLVANLPKISHLVATNPAPGLTFTPTLNPETWTFLKKVLPSKTKIPLSDELVALMETFSKLPPTTQSPKVSTKLFPSTLRQF